ncbi:hypothetical protein Q1695_007914 [Nippostrongylus brasiliensis]|nr:hypothetical protein Q1695_007914 [Nippostrongylus brasiliensis]
MARRSTRKEHEDNASDSPSWAVRLIERFDNFASVLERSLLQSFDKMMNHISDIQENQKLVLARIVDLERSVALLASKNVEDSNVLYSTMVKIRSDSEKIDEKAKRIAWVGIDEKADERRTRLFDREILKEAIYTSGDEELIRCFDEGSITSRRFPTVRSKSPHARGRLIKIALPTKALRDRLLEHMRTGRQNLTKQFVHSFARRDYTTEELQLDRTLRKKAGEMNAREGKLVYVVRDLEIVKLRSPRDLPRSSVSSLTTSTHATHASSPRSSQHLDSPHAPHVDSRRDRSSSNVSVTQTLVGSTGDEASCSH